MVTRESCGFVVAPQDTVAFVNALESAADNRINLVQMGEQAHALANAQFDRDKLANKWVEWVTSSATDVR